MHLQENSGIKAFANVHCRYRLPYQYQDDISYVSVEDVIQAFEELCLHSGDVEQEVLDYFETNYIEEKSGVADVLPRVFHMKYGTWIHVSEITYHVRITM